MHIAIIIGSFYPNWGGAQIRMKQIAEALIPKGFQFTVLTRRLTRTAPVYENVNGIEIIRFHPAEWLFDIEMRQWLKVHYRSINLIHTIRLDKYGPVGAWAHRKYGIAHISDLITVEALKLFKKNDYFSRRKREAILNGTSVLHSINQEMIRFLADHGVAQEKLWYWPNGIDVNYFTPEGRRSLLDDDKIEVIYSGRFERLKGTDVLVEAWKRLPPTILSKSKLILVGSSKPKWDKLIHEAAAGLPNVEFPGPVKRERMLAYYRSVAIYVQPSRYEGFGNSILEAMACGVPIVACNVGGIPDFVSDGVNGLLVPPDDPQALADAIAKLIADPQLRAMMGRESRRIAVASFSLEPMNTAFEEIYSRFKPEKTMINF